MTTNKVRIDTLSGIVEVEGEKEFVDEQMQKIIPLIQASGFGAAAARNNGAAPSGKEDEGEHDDGESGQEDAAQGARKRRKVSMPPKGQSCRDRIKTLKDDGFFKQHRTPSDIVGGLAKKGWTHKVNQVGAALTTMFEKGEVQRTSDGSGFKYFWDRG
jgi:hypothetical protein